MSADDRLPCVEKCIQHVADAYGVTPEWIMADERTMARAKCRALAIALTEKTSILSHREIANEFGMTVSSITKYAVDLRDDPQVGDLLARMERGA